MRKEFKKGDLIQCVRHARYEGVNLKRVPIGSVFTFAEYENSIFPGGPWAHVGEPIKKGQIRSQITGDYFTDTKDDDFDFASSLARVLVGRE